MLTFLGGASTALDSARTALEFAAAALERYDAPDLVRAGVVQPRDTVRLCAPVPKPGKIVGVARNYPAQLAAHGSDEPPKEPVLFLKAPSSVIGPEDDISLPEVVKRVDYAGGLAAIVGTSAHRVSFENALDCLAGYCVANDVTACDLPNQQGQLFLGKSSDTFAPLGPALVTVDEVRDPQNLWIRTIVSGKVVQEGGPRRCSSRSRKRSTSRHSS